MERMIRTSEEKEEKLLDRCLLQMLSLLSNVNINFDVNKYLLRS
jgi:hypothetical protein